MRKKFQQFWTTSGLARKLKMAPKVLEYAKTYNLNVKLEYTFDLRKFQNTTSFYFRSKI